MRRGFKEAQARVKWRARIFNTFPFLFVFLPLILLICLPLSGRALLRALTLASFLFYACAGHAWFLGPMLVTTCLDFYLGQRLGGSVDPRARRAILILSLVCNLGLLFYFKYAGFFLRTVSQLGFAHATGWEKFSAVVLPAGISFYTFQTMSYMIDVYQGIAEPQTDFWKFAAFVSFFPHLVAGPLTRHDQLIPQLTEIENAGVRPRWRAGFYLFFIGLAKKVLIADRIAGHIDPIIDHAVAMGFSGAWAALIGFWLQIYFDFSGYSDMAIGLGRLFGIELPVNFNSPYLSKSPREFWSRWHITFSRWIQDYLFLPLSLYFKDVFTFTENLMIPILAAVIVTMALAGLWHGANWVFVIFGLYHGMLLCVHAAVKKKWNLAPVWAQRGATLFLILLGWVFFRAGNLAECAHWFHDLAGFGGAGGALPASFLILMALGLGVVFGLPNAATYEKFDELPASAQIALGLAASATILTMGGTSRFLYFQF